MDEIPEDPSSEFFQPFIPQTIKFSLETVDYSISKHDDQKLLESPYPPYEITDEMIIHSFYCFFQYVQNGDIQQIIQCLENLRYYSSQTIFPYFDEFIEYDIPSLLINLFSLDIKTKNQEESHHENQNQEEDNISEETMKKQFKDHNQLLIEQKITYEGWAPIHDLNEQQFTIHNPTKTQKDVKDDAFCNEEEEPFEQQTASTDKFTADTIVIENQLSNEYHPSYEAGFSNKEERSDDEFLPIKDHPFSKIDFLHQEQNSNEQQNFNITELSNHKQHSIEQQHCYRSGINQEDLLNAQQSENETNFRNTQFTNEIKQRVDISLIRFITELGKNKKQKIFNVIVQHSFHENLIKAASDFFDNEILIRFILSFYKDTINNFSYTHEHILLRETLDLFREIMLNLAFSKETRLIPIEIFTLFINNKKHLITSIQQDQIINFLIQFFNDQRPCETLWSSFLNFFQSMIIDQQSFNRIMAKIEYYLLKFLAENKIIGVVTKSISILNLRFEYCENPIDAFNPSIHFTNLFKYAKKKNDSLSSASLSMIYNIMHHSPELFIQCLEMNIVDILLLKLENSKIKTQKQALRILALIVSNGDIKTHKRCIELNCIEKLLRFLEYDIEDFLDLVIPALLTLLQVSFKEPGYLFNWERFDAEDGMTTIEALQTSTIENVCLKAPGLLQTIIDMRTQLQI